MRHLLATALLCLVCQASAHALVPVPDLKNHRGQLELWEQAISEAVEDPIAGSSTQEQDIQAKTQAEMTTLAFYGWYLGATGPENTAPALSEPQMKRYLSEELRAALRNGSSSNSEQTDYFTSLERKYPSWIGSVQVNELGADATHSVQEVTLGDRHDEMVTLVVHVEKLGGEWKIASVEDTDFLRD